MFSTLRKEKSIIRFALVGAFNTALGLGLFPVLFWVVGAWLNVNIVLTASYVICATSAFTLHKYFTFGSQGRADTEGIKYIIVNIATWAVNTILLNLVLHYTAVSPIKAQLTIAVLLQLGNYLLFKNFVFRKEGT